MMNLSFGPIISAFYFMTLLFPSNRIHVTLSSLGLKLWSPFLWLVPLEKTIHVARLQHSKLKTNYPSHSRDMKIPYILHTHFHTE